MVNVLYGYWLVLIHGWLMIDIICPTCDLSMNDWLRMVGTITSALVGIPTVSHEPPNSWMVVHVFLLVCCHYGCWLPCGNLLMKHTTNKWGLTTTICFHQFGSFVRSKMFIWVDDRTLPRTIPFQGSPWEVKLFWREHYVWWNHVKPIFRLVVVVCPYDLLALILSTSRDRLNHWQPVISLIASAMTLIDHIGQPVLPPFAVECS